jgi:hypothetical protein
MVVALLLAVIWVAVLVPPAVRSHHARKKAFEVSFGRGGPPAADAPAWIPEGRSASGPGGRSVSAPVDAAPGRRHSPPVQRRRRIAGGLLVAMVASGLAGLLPTFRVLLVVNLFVDDSFLFYVALLAYRADRRTRAARRPGAAPAEARADRAAASRRRRATSVPGVLADLPPVASIG